jgi:plasmid stability protein
MHMPKMIQLRNVPDDVHRALKRRALEEGTTLSDLLVREVTAIARRPTLDDIFARIQRRRTVRVSEPSPEAVRAERQARQ